MAFIVVVIFLPLIFRDKMHPSSRVIFIYVKKISKINDAFNMFDRIPHMNRKVDEAYKSVYYDASNEHIFTLH